MENVVRGALKLKKPIDGMKKKKKKSKSKEGVKEPAAAAGGSSSKAHKEESDSSGDERTEYEKKWDKQVKRVEEKAAKAAAEKSHRERVNDFNEKLSKMSEHYDLPRVAGGG